MRKLRKIITNSDISTYNSEMSSATAAAAFSASVKLPTLISVPHPSTRLSPKVGLNVEGRKSSTSNVVSSQASNRNSQITALLDNVHLSKNGRKRSSQSPHVNVDEIIDLINEKLSTGYHGVEHLFKSNDTHKDGRLSKEAFKWVLNHLCGYISSEAWLKICYIFNLNHKETISFDEFISHFIDNQKVQKEIMVSMTEGGKQQQKSCFHLVQIGPAASLARSIVEKYYQPSSSSSSSSSPTKLSAAYCLALLKAKASQSDFDPSSCLPEECLSNTKLIMPHHLEDLLRKWNLELNDVEFEKLWQRFDLNNSGGVKTRVFLRLINYRPYQLEELSHNLDLMRTQTLITMNSSQKRERHRSLGRPPFTQLRTPITNNFTNETVDNRRRFQEMQRIHIQTAPSLTRSNTNIASLPNRRSVDLIDEKTKKIMVVNDKASDLIVAKSEETAGSVCRSSLSAESRIKSMVHTLKNSGKLASGQDLVAFMNNKLNEGYILMRTAFEYVDQDGFGYLLVEEFKSVLEEFNIRMDTQVYESLLKKYNLVKKKKLVDYSKFLKVFQDQRDLKARLNKSPKQASVNQLLKQSEESILEFFHGSVYIILDAIHNSIGTNQTECKVDQLKKLLELKLNISIDSTQMTSLVQFVSGKSITEQVNDETLLNWISLFEKFSSVDPWKLFKDTIETAKANRLSKTIPENSQQQEQLKPEKVEIPTAILEQNQTDDEDNAQKVASEMKEEEFNSSDEDEEVRKACLLLNGAENCAKSENDDKNYSIQNYLQSITNVAKQSSNLRSKLRDELKQIKKLEKKLENMLRTKFHRMNKAYSIIDSSHTEKIDKAKLKVILEKCNVEMNDDEIDLVWKDFEADVIPFSNFVRRFLRPAEFDKIRELHYKCKIEESLKEEGNLKREETRESRRSHRRHEMNRSISSWDLTSSKTKPIVRLKMSDSLIERLKNFINQNSNRLKAEFEKEDSSLQASLPKVKVLEIFKKLDFLLLKEDTDALLGEFDLNGCEFDYVKFFKKFEISNSSKKKSSLTTTSDNLNPVLRQLILKLRDQESNGTHSTARSSHSNNRDLVNLKTVFKKFDTTKKGYLDHAEFKSLLTSLKIDANSNDMYMIASEFDPQLRGVFCYEMFLKSLIHAIV